MEIGDLKPEIKELSHILTEDGETFTLRSSLTLFNRANASSIILTAIGIGFIIGGFNTAKDWVDGLIVVVFASLCFLLGLLPMVMRAYDFIEVTDTHIKFRLALRKGEITLTPHLKIKVKYRSQKVKRTGMPVTYKGEYDLIVKDRDESHEVFSLEAHPKEEAAADELMDGLKQIIKQRVKRLKP